jgi:uncharacterized phiE125 gp8 family phage protein
MKVTVITPPEPVVTWAELYAVLKLDTDEEKTLGESYIAQVTDWLNAPRGFLDRSIFTQTLEARFRRFDGDEVALPYGPIQSVTSLKYLDDDGAEQTFASASYQLLKDGRISVDDDIGWPDLYDDEEAVRVLYVAGHTTVPAVIKGAILAGAATMFDNRQAGLEAAIPVIKVLAQGYRNLL